MFALAVRYGALTQNPVREIEPLGKKRRTPARALDAEDRQQWFELLRQDERAVRADLIEISKFMLATGERIGETLAVIWSGIDRESGLVDCSHQIQRLVGKGLVRREVKTAAGERVLILPDWALDMVNARGRQTRHLTHRCFQTRTAVFGIRTTCRELYAARVGPLAVVDVQNSGRR